ncbi:hypothetical protein SAMN05444354_104123 [Stigmatella aurantiaca]|uniref:WD40-like Beta Propeller Repeat n=1 Tax=Stigmatella aurantiaca TaxID=41 RepID=A0A1H7MVQ8_STIAU|nr:hypothetical protein [Stigmatella aurantiaca]SEL15129.1 hypothetical protein SAMN05444354_104123 [Stigmatella aurantiaca]
MLRLFLVFLGVLAGGAQAEGVGAPLVGTRRAVNAGPGHQFEAHVSGSWAVYTHWMQGVSEIRWHELSTGEQGVIPDSSGFDVVADVSGDGVVFTRVTSASSVFFYDLKQRGPPVELAPRPSARRRGAVIGQRTVAWQDYSYAPQTLQPEIATVDLESGVLTRLTDDDLPDRTPMVSPDGRVIVWTKCAQPFDCDIWEAVAGEVGFKTRALTGPQGDESQPQTNGEVVVYTSRRIEQGTPTQDIYWQAVGGGAEYRLALPGLDSRPVLSGSLLAFEWRDPAAPFPNPEIMLFDLRTHTLYALTNTFRGESLNDIGMDARGRVHVLWTTQENGFDVRALTFQQPVGDGRDNPSGCPGLRAACVDPGERPLLSSVTLRRFSGAPQRFQALFPASGQGLLCVDNGHEGTATALGWVKINGTAVLDPSAFQKETQLLAKQVALDGRVQLEALIDGPSGGAFRMRLYDDSKGSTPCQEPFPGEELLPGKSVAPQVWGVAEPVERDVLSETPQVAHGGCSQGGGGPMALAVWLGLVGLAGPWRVLVRARRGRSAPPAR